MADGRTAQMTDVHFDTELGATTLPALSQLLGDDQALDGLLGSGQAVPAAQSQAAAVADAVAESAELLRQLAEVTKQQAAVTGG